MTQMTQYDNILLACEETARHEGSHFLPEHLFGYILDGSLQIEGEGRKTIYEAGSCGVFRRNQLGRFMKHPPAGGSFRSVTIVLDEPLLRAFSQEYQTAAAGSYTGAAILELTDPLLDTWFRSFVPYFDPSNQLSAALVSLKLKEAIHLLLHVHPPLKDMLFDFRQPGKLDLEAFMVQNYMHNVPISRLAMLTGRSLTMFKEDFNRVFGTSPGRWLQQRRLSEAMVLIKEKGQRASDIYLDLGFEDLSHFSFAFKKQFGVPPSLV
jgi:AraC-like DNA-binding protein